MMDGRPPIRPVGLDLDGGWHDWDRAHALAAVAAYRAWRTHRGPVQARRSAHGGAHVRLWRTRSVWASLVLRAVLGDDPLRIWIDIAKSRRRGVWDLAHTDVLHRQSRRKRWSCIVCAWRPGGGGGCMAQPYTGIEEIL